MIRTEFKPALEGAKVLVYREDVGAGYGGEGGLCEDEVEGGFEVCEEDAALGAEDGHVGAATVEAEDAWEAEVRILGVWRREGARMWVDY